MKAALDKEGVTNQDLRNRLIRLWGHHNLTGTTRLLDDASQRISRYLFFQLILNFGFGAALTIGLWLLASFMTLGLLLPMWAKAKANMKEYSSHPSAQDFSLPPLARVSVPYDSFLALAIASTAIAAVSTSASLLAAISTVWLVLSVRRSTLQQISAGLAEISEQLRQMQAKSSHP